MVGRKKRGRDEVSAPALEAAQPLVSAAQAPVGSAEFHHITVLREQTVAFLAPERGGMYVDVTLGGAGHSAWLLSQTGPETQLIGLDRDPMALEAAAQRLAPFEGRFQLASARFSELAQALERLGVSAVDGVMADLGVSSPQLDRAERGFSFMKDGPLDMRMDPTQGMTASELVMEASQEELRRIFWEYGEERQAGRIAGALVRARQTRNFTRTRELAELVAQVAPLPPHLKIHPATRVFQALRIAVNDELTEVERGLEAAFQSLKPGGRLAIIAFHSLEDRIVKHLFREKAASCVCPPGLPICMCKKRVEARILTTRPHEPTEQEITANPRARSARLRALERL